MDYVDNLRQRIRNRAFVLHWGEKTDFQPVQEPRKGRIAMVQKACKSIIALAFLISANVAAQAPGPQASAPLTIKPDAPDRYVVVPGDQPRVPLTFVDYGDESDAGAPGLPGYPIPEEAKTQAHYIEGDAPGGGTSGDRHLLIVDRDRWLLYESYATRWNSSLQRWEAGSGAVFDLSFNGRRPEGWTSADAAGLALFPGLVRFDEVESAPEIRHAFRVTVRATNACAARSSAQASSPGASLRCWNAARLTM